MTVDNFSPPALRLVGLRSIADRQLLACAPVAEALPSPDLYARDEKAYWARVRKQFVIPPGVVHLNNGTVGSSPRPVLRAVYDAYEEIERLTPADPEDYPLWGYGRSRPFNAFRDVVAEFIGSALRSR